MGGKATRREVAGVSASATGIGSTRGAARIGKGVSDEHDLGVPEPCIVSHQNELGPEMGGGSIEIEGLHQWLVARFKSVCS